MRIFFGLCDDEPAQAACLQLIIERWAAERGHHTEIRAFTSAEAFLFAYDEDKRFDILLLDIQMNGMDGVTLAKKIRSENSRSQIIFITGYTDFYADGYEVDALHYLLKPVDEDKLRAVLDKAFERLQSAERVILLPDGAGFARVTENGILYAEAFSHHITLVTTTGTTDYKIRISDMEERLGDGFFRCHRSYVVNMRHVRRITRTELFLTDGTTVPLARGLYDAAYRQFMDG